VLFPTSLEPFTLPGASARVTAVPAAHYDKEYYPDRGHRYIGYLIEWNGVTFYHAGDTILYPGYVDMLRQLPRIDVAILPVNGRDYYRETELGAIGNLLLVEGRGSRDLGWDVLIPGHNDLYPNNAIPMEQIVAALAQTAPRQRYKFL
jgi:L-ascorbate metabolism protein UlaG (beta-lactamase superfamily)